jgi:hypothetical protein
MEPGGCRPLCQPLRGPIQQTAEADELPGIASGAQRLAQDFIQPGHQHFSKEPGDYFIGPIRTVSDDNGHGTTMAIAAYRQTANFFLLHRRGNGVAFGGQAKGINCH